MKVWLDDMRIPPDGEWYWAQTFDEMMFLLKNNIVIEELSLDNDLGTEKEGRHVVLYMAEHGGWPKQAIHVHTSNPVAREYMLGMIKRYAPEHLVS